MKLCRVTGSRTSIMLELLRVGASAITLRPDGADELALELIRKADASRALAKLHPSQKPRKKRKARR